MSSAVFQILVAPNSFLPPVDSSFGKIPGSTTSGVQNVLRNLPTPELGSTSGDMWQSGCPWGDRSPSASRRWMDRAAAGGSQRPQYHTIHPVFRAFSPQPQTHRKCAGSPSPALAAASRLGVVIASPHFVAIFIPVAWRLAGEWQSNTPSPHGARQPARVVEIDWRNGAGALSVALSRSWQALRSR